MATHPHIYLGSRRRWHCIAIFIQEEIVTYLATHLNGIWEQMATNFNTCPIGDGHWILEVKTYFNILIGAMTIHFNLFLGGGGHSIPGGSQYLHGRRCPLISIFTWEGMITHFNIYLGGDGHSFPYLSKRGWPLIPIHI